MRMRIFNLLEGCYKITVVKRNRTEIIIPMLQVVNDRSSDSGSSGITKTNIMYRAFLNYIQLEEYLSLLIEGDLLQYHKATATFKIIQKGRGFLKTFNHTDKPLKIREFAIE
jgi:predicted transcriptional regulator